MPYGATDTSSCPPGDEAGDSKRQDGLAVLPPQPDAVAEDASDDASLAHECHGDDSYQHSWQHGLKEFYERNLGLFLFTLGEAFGSVMQTAAKYLATETDPKFHPLQIIFVRMTFTASIGFVYMRVKKIPNAPFGPPEVRGLLLLRGFAGFGGYLGLLYSLIYLDMSDAVTLTFTIPILTALISWIALGETFTLREALAGLVAFAGVLLVARPSFLFNHPLQGSEPIKAPPQANATAAFAGPASTSPFSFEPGLSAANELGALPQTTSSASEAERAFAVVCALLGSLGSAIAYTTIRGIGLRAHSLISVNYFALTSVIGSTAIILLHPDLSFDVPHGALQWGLICVVGLTGFLLQFLLSEGLQREKAGRATNLIYTNLVFAIIFEKIIWGTTPALLSLLGCGMIIGAAVWVTMQKNQPQEKQKQAPVDEESRLLGSE